eukprot:m.52028 g.52028  ORF g.52028 m.52028 type:complete len:245 (-) comp10769_c0_seq1:64-798(-)
MGKKFYAVVRGWKTGIFEEWDAGRTNGFAGAMHKSFASRQAAKLYLDANKTLMTNTPKAGGPSFKKKPKITPTATPTADLGAKQSVVARPGYCMYFDGGSRGNPGIAGAGAVLFKDGVAVEKQRVPLGKGTCNQAEYVGFISGLLLAKKHKVENLHVIGDSKLVINQMLGLFQAKAVKIVPLYKFAKDVVSKSQPKCTYQHVLRMGNKDADQLANEAMDMLNGSQLKLFSSEDWVEETRKTVTL